MKHRLSEDVMVEVPPGTGPFVVHMKGAGGSRKVRVNGSFIYDETPVEPLWGPAPRPTLGFERGVLGETFAQLFPRAWSRGDDGRADPSGWQEL